ncbi:MAG: hypothetical protein QM229_06695 [Bacillota bacterium]|nr:hypothetical protein [Bacillota bacterium]
MAKTNEGINSTVVNPNELLVLNEVEDGFVLSRANCLAQNF